MESRMSSSLHGKRGLVVGIANEASIAAGCARACVAAGASLTATYLNDKALPHVRAVTEPLGATLLLPCDVRAGRTGGRVRAPARRVEPVGFPAARRRVRARGLRMARTFYGSERVVAHYNLMGAVKAALESAVRYTAAELGPKGIRAHAISPGPIRTRAASGIDRFDELLAAAVATAPEHLVDIDDVGALAAFLVSDGARRITGTAIPVDGGQHLVA